MSSMSIGGVAGSQGVTAPTPGDGTTASAGLDKNAFLQLLVAQLRYQDPSSPMDSSAYMSQMAQFTQVESLQNMQTSQTDLLNWQRAVAGEGMLGRTISATDAKTGAAVTGEVVGMQLTSNGPALMLKDGTTISVDSVTTVTPTAATTTDGSH